jgi:hypothetical protein
MAGNGTIAPKTFSKASVQVMSRRRRPIIIHTTHWPTKCWSATVDCTCLISEMDRMFKPALQRKIQISIARSSSFGPPIRNMTAGTSLLLLSLLLLLQPAIGLNIVVAGATGRLGRILIPKLLLVEQPSPSSSKDANSSSRTTTAVTVLTRNSFLASTPTRVSEDYGHLGKGYIERYPMNLRLRDWDGGDLLDIVGRDWVGWQRDTLPQADVILHLTGGGFTEQRVMACERLVRESIKHNRLAHHITINPSAELLTAMSPGLMSVKTSRIDRCEAMVRENCQQYTCLRIEQRDIDAACQTILDALAAVPRQHQEQE